MSKYLIVYNDLHIGGIQTQILQFCIHLSSLDHEVHIILHSRQYNTELLEKISGVASVHFWDDWNLFPKTLYSGRCTFLSFLMPRKTQVTKVVGDVDFVVAMSSVAAWHALLLFKQKILKPKTFALCAYHSLEYVATKKDCALWKVLLSKIVRSVPSTNFISTSYVTQSKLAEIFCTKPDAIPLVGGAVSVPDKVISKPKSDVLRIITIGRLVPFKSYIGAFLESIPYLKQRGVKIQYTIVGAGEMRIALGEMVDRLKITDCVDFVGQINFSQIDDYIDSSDCFLGSGTSLIQAAGRSCPSVIGIESNSEPDTYGYLHETSGYKIHEAGLPYCKKSFFTLFYELYELNNEDYNHLRMLDYQRACTFSPHIVFEQLTSNIQSATTIPQLSFFSIIHVYLSFLLAFAVKIFHFGLSLNKHYDE